MQFRGFRPLLAFAYVFLGPAPAVAGMPSPVVLTEWAVRRLSAISFFVVVLLVSAAIVHWLWNSLSKDFPRLPRLSYGKSLAAVVLLGVALMVVLTMIAGARELLTPGAWQKDGALYKVEAPQEQTNEHAPQKRKP